MSESKMSTSSGKVTRRRVVAGAAALMAAPAALAACGPAEMGGGKPAPAKVSGALSYMDFRLTGNPVDQQFYKAVTDGFAAKHPEVKFEQIQTDFGTVYLEKVVTMAASGTPADVMFSSVVWGRDFWSDGMLEDLAPYIARTPSVAPGQYLDAANFYTSWKGKTFGIPHVGPDFDVFWVNRRLLQEVGLPATDEALAKWTWDDLTAAHPKLLKRGADGKLTRGGVVYNPTANLRHFTTWLYSNDGVFYKDKERTTVGFNDAKGRQVLQHMVDLRHKHQTTEALPAGTDLLNKAFPEGGVPIMQAGGWEQRQFFTNPAISALDFTMMTFPRGPMGKTQATVAWSNMNVMSKGGKNKDAAWAFVEYYSGLQVAQQQFDIWKQVSPRKDFLESTFWKEATKKYPSYSNFRKFADLGGMYPYLKFNDVTAQLMPLVKEVVIDQKRSVSEGLGEMERLANQILATVK